MKNLHILLSFVSCSSNIAKHIVHWHFILALQSSPGPRPAQSFIDLFIKHQGQYTECWKRIFHVQNISRRLEVSKKSCWGFSSCVQKIGPFFCFLSFQISLLLFMEKSFKKAKMNSFSLLPYLFKRHMKGFNSKPDYCINSITHRYKLEWLRIFIGTS